jgi:hypothetical protein
MLAGGQRLGRDSYYQRRCDDKLTRQAVSFRELFRAYVPQVDFGRGGGPLDDANPTLATMAISTTGKV